MKLLDNLIRDITKAGFMPKSEARRRVQEIIDYALEKQRRKIVREINKVTTYDHKQCPIPQTCIGYENCLSDLEHGVPTLKHLKL